jgi:Nicastrin small lobe
MFSIFLLLQNAFAEMYLDIYTYQGIEAEGCTRLLNANGELGCSSKSTLTSGILYQITEDSEIDSFISTTSGNFWAIVMPASLMSPSNLDKLMNRVAGIVLVKDAIKPQSYSLDAKIPNRDYGLYRDERDLHIWNPNGKEMLANSYDISIFEVFTSDLSNPATNNLYQAVNKNKESGYSTYPLYAIDFRNRMNAEINAHRCLSKSIFKI